ncbi:G-type lectin S-receptor-like serine/threonine-protein kinase SD2-5 [Lactuca sativa]|uniref:Receptor-like serine/threonine-protein kinase n=1 Tax=Lactuca sativa TaxID=4236 RepID=A0A9R1WW68_LACSA|nr:G-type lectin S-receptor-like serine/threonine-protein kinase SD2-5 [Lactuca sativa]KAJ0191275.1 hypothetical protein LSAT_V11C800400050 [Lactuca sativa]
MMRTPCICSFLFGFFLIFSSIAAQLDYVSNANLSSTWTNNESSIPSSNSPDGSRIRIILSVKYRFACGFFCNGTCTSFLFAILFNTNDHVILWSANRDNPVRESAILNFTAAGELVLQDVDGSTVWTTNTTEKSVAFMNLTDKGNLMLFDNTKSMVWQSFDHPTDCLLPGQKLFQGQKLIPSVSSTNWTAQKDSYSLQLTHEGLFAYVGSNPPQVYFPSFGIDIDMINSYFKFFNGSLSFVDSMQYSLQYVKLMPDGHLKGFTVPDSVWADFLTGDLGECSYPLTCGRNSICSAERQCTCPGIDSFRAVNDRKPNMGCFPVTPLTCNATHDQHFIELTNIAYINNIADMEDVDIEICKQACLKKCSCKAAVFEYGSNTTSGRCYLLSELFTMPSVEAGVLPYNILTHIKVQNVTSSSMNVTSSSSSRNLVATVLGYTIGSFVLLIVVVGFIMFAVRKEKTNSEMEEEHLDQVPGMPIRFSYEQLKTATQNFSKKLGEGGFASVFKGTLEDGLQIAVKHLQGDVYVHVKKSFMAEVESIGSIHHVNLVQLKGFSAWKSERLLVYEFMSNGSLDQWIYYSGGDHQKHLLGWECRKKIILDIAKGLAYLHEERSQKIIHLDIKPQNILLDSNFNAKVSDFGLSKLIDRNQSRQVMTTMRGTFGYMAPEWLSSVITEKVDVYSFGIVLLEILCGRKNLDRSQPEESWHLLGVFQRCWEQGTLLDIVDRYSEDMQLHATEVTEMMKVVSWCLQTDFTRRPSMSTVIKVLEGVISVESNLDYNFSCPRLQETTFEHDKSSKPACDSILSGPR